MEKLFYKRDVNKSVLWDGFGIEREYQPYFLEAGGKLERGEVRPIKLLFLGKTYDAKVYNLNNRRDQRKNDSYQIRYPANGEFARVLQGTFWKTWKFVTEAKALKGVSDDRSFVKIPEEYKEYLAIYTTEQKDVYLCEAILRDDMEALRESVKQQSERQFEAIFNYDIEDKTATIRNKEMLVRVRKLNRMIGEHLKQEYDYRCQICGRKIGEKYSSNLVEAHHIDYFVKSLNNNSSNQMIVCPNHHAIIHDRNPIFNRKKLTYLYPNGLEEGLALNKHL